jgi:hypothetical protein
MTSLPPAPQSAAGSPPPGILSRLQACLADLDGYITRRAEDLAAPMIRDAEARARLAIVEAAGETQRQRALVEELRKRLRVQEQMREREQDARARLAALLRYPVATNPAGLPPLAVLVAEVEKALAERADHD